ncbi:hypothetical protein [Algoriphagus resistens]|uniref:hypothetical protein n=1 Tax=Algoriphagus resistens TaxID=1750590 RepID=UPI000ACFDF30|nr:hypothetical protein [Algoriphagus resistens]
MATYLVRFLLSFSILLSSGYSAVYANIDSDTAMDSLGSSFETVQGTNNSRQHPLTFSAPKQQGKDIFIVNNSKVEEEDDEFVSDHSFVNSTHLSALYFARIFGFLFQDFTQDLHSSKFVPNTITLRKHLVIQVFRI